jgi:hypothetical protein
MSGVHCSHSSTMRLSSLQSLGRLSLRALRRTPSATPLQATAPRTAAPCSTGISSFAGSSSSRLPAAAARRSQLACASSHARAVAVAAAAASPAVLEPAAQQQAAAVSASSNGNGSTAPSFQEAIKRLQDYWASEGCVVWLPHNTEVGAGTMNPATFLR